MNISLCCSLVAIPVYLRHNITYREVGTGRLDITVGPKQTMGKTVIIYSLVIYRTMNQ